MLLTFLSACAGSSLKPWHTERLTSEFDVGKTDEIRTFDDYRQLEDRLFEELEEKVYAQTATGPAYALTRYSAGSAADPMARQPNWNHSFEIPHDDAVAGVLLLHGMTDSPYTHRALGQALGENGYWVVGLRLPGHGTAPSGLTRVTWRDMAAAVEIAMTHLSSKVDGRPIHIVGYSNGAGLALNFALDALDGDATPLPASLVLISPAIGIHSAAALAVWSDRISRVPGFTGLSWAQIEPEFDPYKYNSFAMNGGTQVHNLTRSVARRIRERAEAGSAGGLPRILVFKSTVDATVTTEALVDSLLVHLPPKRNELVLFDINRFAAKARLMISDPGPFTERLMTDDSLPFAIELITNESPESRFVVSRHKPPHSNTVSADKPLNVPWPRGVISLYLSLSLLIPVSSL
jgi:alpha-beta hydrolase superfamily lysophospholipase